MTGRPPRPPPRYLNHEETRHGTFVWYVRIGKGPRIRIREEYNSEAFWQAYYAALAGEQPQTRKTLPKKDSLEWLIERYRETAAWAELSAATHKQRNNVFSHVIKAEGKTPFDLITKKVIQAGLDRRASKPAAAKHFLQSMRGLFQWATGAAAHLETDPTAGLSVKRRKTKGHKPWTIEWCERYEKRWPTGTRQRLALDVLLYTGLRRGDAARLGMSHIKDGVLTMQLEKGGEMTTLTLPILPPLARSMAAGPVGKRSIISGERGEPLTKETFGNYFREWCEEAGVPGSAHGLRKASAERAAEAGATEHEMMAMFGWTDPRIAFLYTRNANRKRMAEKGAEKVSRELYGEPLARTPKTVRATGRKTKEIQMPKSDVVGPAGGPQSNNINALSQGAGIKASVDSQGESGGPPAPLIDLGKLSIRDGAIHYRLYAQDGSMIPMTVADSRENRLFVSWVQMHDRYSPTLSLHGGA